MYRIEINNKTYTIPKENFPMWAKFEAIQRGEADILAKTSPKEYIEATFKAKVTELE